jgi:beta-glucosidase
VLFPFGHGLSYTTFEYSDLQLSRSQITEADTLTATLRVKNTGTVAGMETVQLYVRDVETTVFRPEKELKEFFKIELQPGEGAELAIELDRRAFAYYDTGLKDWHVEAGAFEVLVGASSRDIRLSATVEVVSTRQVAVTPDREGLGAYYDFPKGVPVDKKSFETLLGRPVPPNEAPTKGSYTINTPVGDMTDSFVGRQLSGLMKRQIAKMIEGQEDTPIALLMAAMAREMPLRGMLMVGDGSITREMLDALLVVINGRPLKGLSALIGAIRRR